MPSCQSDTVHRLERSLRRLEELVVMPRTREQIESRDNRATAGNLHVLEKLVAMLALAKSIFQQQGNNGLLLFAPQSKQHVYVDTPDVRRPSGGKSHLRHPAANEHGVVAMRRQ